jgi:hypothetical protein
MDKPQIPDERAIVDAVWAEFGAFQPDPEPVPVPGNAVPSVGSPAARRTRQVV